MLSFGRLLKKCLLNNSMFSFRNWLLSEEAKEFSSTHVSFDRKDSERVLSWSKKHIKASNLAEDGIEDEPHVTVLFGLHTSDYKEVKELVSDYGEFEIKLGKISKFPSQEYDVLKIDVSGDDLYHLNKKLRELPHTSSFHDYKPHCTLAYVKKGSCDEFLGNRDFEGQTIKVRSIVFSSKDRVKTKIDLG